MRVPQLCTAAEGAPLPRPFGPPSGATDERRRRPHPHHRNAGRPPVARSGHRRAGPRSPQRVRRAVLARDPRPAQYVITASSGTIRSVPTTERSRRAAILTRISLDRTGDSASPERQEWASRQLAEQKGWAVVQVFEDRDTSGFDRRARRPGFEALKGSIRAGEVDAVIADSLSRIGRRAVGLWSFIEFCQDHGCEVACVKDPVDTTTAAGRLIVGFLASLAQWESELISERVRSHYQMAAEQGRMSSGGSRQFGYGRDGLIVSNEASVVREVAARIISGESLRQVAFSLNDRAVKTSMGNQWQSATLGQMIRSPRLAARRVHGDAVHDGNWVPILDTDEHAAVLATLNARSSPTRRTVPRHLLTGLVVCGLCGGHLKTMGFRMHNGKHFGRYQCVKQPGMVNCGGVAVAKDSLDRFVINEVLRFLVGFNLRPMPDDRRQDALEREVAEDERALVELTQARFYERTISQEEYGPARQSLQERLAANRAALEAMERQREALP